MFELTNFLNIPGNLKHNFPFEFFTLYIFPFLHNFVEIKIKLPSIILLSFFLNLLHKDQL